MTLTASSASTTATRGHEIRLANVSKHYPRTVTPAVDDVSLSIARGEFMTFLGPSGSGKTTTLQMIAGFTSVTAGSIAVDDRDISALKPHKRNLGVVFQQYALFPHLTVAENVAYPLRRRGLPKTEIIRRTAEALDLVSLAPLGERYPKQLSGGQQQRVALARAVVYEPGALLLDEPLGALDKKLRDGLQRQIRRMHEELGMTFIFITHDQEEALALSDRIAIFNEGRIVQVGTPTELYDRPSSLFAAQFLGESNVFEGELSNGVLDTALFRAPVDQDVERRVGRRAASIVRPERITVTAVSDDVPADRFSLRSTVTDLSYVGSHWRVGLRFADGSAGSALSIASHTAPAAVGDTVHASWVLSEQTVVRVD